MSQRKEPSIIFTHTLDKVSKKIFEKPQHREKIIKYIGKQTGVYALYNQKKLYYIGQASDLARRIKNHLNNQHANFWTDFSVYFIKKASFVNDIESIMISIMKPEGNRNKPMLGKKINLIDILKKDIEKEHQDELEKLGLIKNRSNVLKMRPKKPRANKSTLFIPKDTIIKSEYQKRGYPKKIYEAMLLTSGKVKYKGEIYSSPTDAAKAITLYKSQNGLVFWSIQNNKGKWIKLNKYKKSINKRNHQEELEKLGSTKNKNRSNVLKIRPKKLRANKSKLLILKDTIIKAEYQKRGCSKKIYKAILLTSGKVKYEDKLYNSLTHAAQAITLYKSQSGPRFWSILNDKGEWIKLNKYERSMSKGLKSA